MGERSGLRSRAPLEKANEKEMESLKVGGPHEKNSGFSAKCDY